MTVELVSGTPREIDGIQGVHRPITHVVVAVPARNEERQVRSCLTSVLRACAGVDTIHCTVVLAADDCTDGTVAQAEQVRRRSTNMSIIEGTWRSPGAARAAAVEAGMHALGGTVELGNVWIVTTDADTDVPADWIRRHVAHADGGADAVAGVVRLRRDSYLTPLVESAFLTTYLYNEDRTHPHVHGANLGVRGSAYTAAGGFANLEVAEDHALWKALGRAGFRRASPTDVIVATSARLRSRTRGGFADILLATVERQVL